MASDVGPRDGEQRAEQHVPARANAPESAAARATQQVQEHGLDLVVAGVARQDARGPDLGRDGEECLVAGTACARLEPPPRRDGRDPLDESDAEARRVPADGVAFGGALLAAQPMIDVHGGEAPLPRRRESGDAVQQRRRVGSAGDRQQEVLAGTRPAAGVEGGRQRTVDGARGTLHRGES